MEWINATKRPERSDEYLCCFEGWDDMVCIRTLEFDKPFDEWSDHNGEPYLNVTHWQELPKPPTDNN